MIDIRKVTAEDAAAALGLTLEAWRHYGCALELQRVQGRVAMALEGLAERRANQEQYDRPPAGPWWWNSPPPVGTRVRGGVVVAVYPQRPSDESILAWAAGTDDMARFIEWSGWVLVQSDESRRTGPEPARIFAAPPMLARPQEPAGVLR